LALQRVVITGIGAITPLANDFLKSWELLKSGKSAINRITKFDPLDCRWKAAGEVKGFEPELYLSKKEILRLDPFVHYAVAAAAMAVEDAGLISSNKLQVTSNELNDLKLNSNQNSSLVTRHPSLNYAGVIIGSSRGGITTIERELHNLYGSRFTVHGSRISPYLMPSTTISMAASYAAQKLGIKGYCLGISNACASGTNAIGEAYRLIKNGYLNIMLAGGVEAPICRFCVEGYGISGALSALNNPSASRPFDKKRDGFVIAEGACIMVLESYESAVKRNANIYAEIIGYGNTTDAFHITKPDANGETAAILAALKEAEILPEKIDYINAHGTSTPLGDKTEAKAILKAFKKASDIPVSAIKSGTGHMLAASGAFEAACTAMSIKEGIVPPTINITDKDPECDINVITKKIKADIKTAITNSFGFGGVNAVIVLKRAVEQKRRS
jgi:3-oxoacyl-[acyl-carrier-protein] synthase II